MAGFSERLKSLYDRRDGRIRYKIMIQGIKCHRLQILLTNLRFVNGGNGMKATGIVRRIDDLGRIVIPKEIMRTLRIRESDHLEIFTDREGEIILK